MLIILCQHSTEIKKMKVNSLSDNLPWWAARPFKPESFESWCERVKQKLIRRHHKVVIFLSQGLLSGDILLKDSKICVGNLQKVLFVFSNFFDGCVTRKMGEALKYYDWSSRTIRDYNTALLLTEYGLQELYETTKH